jgi:hypothetical protein
MKYDIHIHLPGGEDKSQPKKVQEDSDQPSWVTDILKRVGMCHNWRSLYQMSKDFNRLGLAIKETVGNRRILCRLEEGKPQTEDINRDYIFIGAKDKMDLDISERTMEVIRQFITENIGEPQLVVDDDQSYSNNMALYGKPIQLYNETYLEESQQIKHMGSVMNEDLNAEI